MPETFTKYISAICPFQGLRQPRDPRTLVGQEERLPGAVQIKI
jgi:hypothetical protein